jgi:hypothetical protein
MAVLADKKTIAAPFANASELVRVTYDFDVDGGAIADYDVLEADGNLLVELVNADVKTAVTSADAILFDIGKGAGGVEFWSDVVKGTLTLDAQVASENACKIVELADGEKIVMGIEAFAATAGKITFTFRVYARV